GPITLAQAVNAGGGTVRINSGGAVAQTGGAGVITAQNLVVRAAGNVDLSQVSNNVPGNFAALDTAAGAFLRFLDSAGFTVSTVGGDSCAQGMTGIMTTNGDVSLRSTGGNLSIVQPINAGSGTIRLRSPGAVTQSGSGTITGSTLGVQAGGTVSLPLTNSLAVFAAQGGGDLTFNDVASLTIATVSADPTGFTGASGIIAPGQ